MQLPCTTIMRLKWDFQQSEIIRVITWVPTVCILCVNQCRAHLNKTQEGVMLKRYGGCVSTQWAKQVFFAPVEKSTESLRWIFSFTQVNLTCGFPPRYTVMKWSAAVIDVQMEALIFIAWYVRLVSSVSVAASYLTVILANKPQTKQKTADIWSVTGKFSVLFQIRQRIINDTLICTCAKEHMFMSMHGPRQINRQIQIPRFSQSYGHMEDEIVKYCH